VLDHLVYATPDVDASIDDLEKRWGVRAAMGGKHPGGTHNALLALGDGGYLEIIGPDPEQTITPGQPMAFGIDRLKEPRLVTWAIKAPGIAERVARARRGGYDPGDPQPLSRKRPDGLLLEWRLTRAPVQRGDGLVPFLIDWGDTPHPAESTPGGCVFASLRAEHPDPGTVRALMRAVGEELDVRSGPAPALIATIHTPNGRMELR
jgi:hypothetical protein